MSVEHAPAPPRLLASGDTAITVEFARDIDDEANSRVIALDAALADRQPEGVVETVPTYRSLLVHVDPVLVDWPVLRRTLLELAAVPARSAMPASSWRVPVAYGGVFGSDLDAAAEQCGLAPRQLVEAHAAGRYRVAMIGFMPGFSYLSGLDPALAVPRKTQPAAKVPASSVSIGGAQTAIGSVEAPSGWHMLGRTPARLFMLRRDPQVLFAPGDWIRFVPIDAEMWLKLDHAAAKGALVAERERPG